MVVVVIGIHCPGHPPLASHRAALRLRRRGRILPLPARSLWIPAFAGMTAVMHRSTTSTNVQTSPSINPTIR